jgi:glycosyltransferase involved in cell wall biosynthesis
MDRPGRQPLVSVIICTRDRCDALRRTLAGLATVSIPADWRAELIVVDNGSRDGTPEVVRTARLKHLAVRYVREERGGQSLARNTGLAASSGEVILFTDDDVRPSEDWLERMAAPLLGNECDAVSGRVDLGGDSARPWMSGMHRAWLAARDDEAMSEPEMIGASMGFARAVLRHVPAFDPELGPGALGYMDDTLFSWQLRQAGLRLRSLPAALVVHEPDTSRLTRSQWLRAASHRGRSRAYVLHHWEHRVLKHPLAQSCYFAAKLHFRRRLQARAALRGEGCAPWEMSYVVRLAMCGQFRIERRRPRNYPRLGLIKAR